MISNNPLMNFARKAELSVRLPSNGHWYEDGMIEYTPNGEVEVYPMLPKDELMMLNPDALLSGQANINLIKSCVPSIKEPEKLLYPDANVLFLAIQKATYGDELKFTTNCPQCHKKMDTMSDEEIIEMEKKQELLTHGFDVSFNIMDLLNDMTYLEKEYVVNFDNGLNIYLSPNTIGDKALYSNMTFKYEKMINIFKHSEKSSDELFADKDYANEINAAYMSLNEISNKILTASIIKITLPDDTTVNDKLLIEEFVNNISTELVNKLTNKVREINAIGLSPMLHIICPTCGYEWDTQFYGYNQSDFFGIGY